MNKLVRYTCGAANSIYSFHYLLYYLFPLSNDHLIVSSYLIFGSKKLKLCAHNFKLI